MITLSEKKTLDTGGGCTVDFATVVGISGTKSIGYTSDCIVGYCCRPEDVRFDGTQELWTAHSAGELELTLGSVNAYVVRQFFKTGGDF